MFINGAKIQMNVARFARYETFLCDFQTLWQPLFCQPTT